MSPRVPGLRDSTARPFSGQSTFPRKRVTDGATGRRQPTPITEPPGLGLDYSVPKLAVVGGKDAASVTPDPCTRDQVPCPSEDPGGPGPGTAP